MTRNNEIKYEANTLHPWHYNRYITTTTTIITDPQPALSAINIIINNYNHYHRKYYEQERTKK